MKFCGFDPRQNLLAEVCEANGERVKRRCVMRRVCWADGLGGGMAAGGQVRRGIVAGSHCVGGGLRVGAVKV